MLIAKRFLFDEVFPIGVGSNPQPWPPSNHPFIDPGVYIMYGRVYDCTEPGLYLWKQPEEPGIGARIIHTGDPYELLSAMSWRHCHGVEHDGLPQSTLSAYANGRKLRLTCGFFVDWIRPWLTHFGYSSRRVSVITTGPENGFDDGHVVVEVKINGAWRMFDMSNGTYFTRDGEHIDTAAFMSLLASGERPEMIRLDAGDKYNAEINAQYFCHGSYADLMLRFKEDRWQWYERIFGRVLQIL